MSKKLICWVPFVLGLLLTNTGAAELNPVAFWLFDDGAGDIATDSSGNGNNGTMNGPTWSNEGMFGGALSFDGANDYVEVPASESLEMGTSDLTVSCWFKTSSPSQQRPFTKGAVNLPSPKGYATFINGGRLAAQLTNSVERATVRGPTNITDGQWHYLTCVWERNGTTRTYVDGVLDAEAPTPFQGEDISDSSAMVIIGKKHYENYQWLNGLLDELVVFKNALTEEEIALAATGLENFLPSPQARKPIPADGATDLLQRVVLNWKPGEYADQHDVYFGTSFDDVNNAATTVGPAGVYRGGHNASSYDVPERLDLGQTYYWRVDEVNAPPTSHVVFKGDVWSFTVEPWGYPIENITVTASSEIRAGEGPENTINGSGLDDDDLHSAENADMWLSNVADPDGTWIQYEFDAVRRLHQMWVWNYNSSTEPVVGFGIKEATIEYSVDGTNWATLGTTHEFAQGSGVAGYAPNTTVDLGGVAARYVRITVNSNWGGLVNQYGLSEVRFLYIPVLAREPNPASGATDVGVDVTLAWRAGREAARHDVYLSTDEQALIDGNAPIATVTEPSYAPSVDLASTYYWRIDEVNDAESPTTWQSDIWNFSTQEYSVVDDFESYNDIPAGEEDSHLVYEIWSDGFADPSKGGSQIGYFAGTSLETDIVYDGSQSVPLLYDNTVAAYSEVTVNVADLHAGQDWAKHGIKALTLHFYGDPNNSVNEQMYVKINGSKVTYDGDAENLKRAGWQMWYIDLASIGVDLSNVTELSIGFERIGVVGGQGVVLLDGIRLYSYDRQLITPADPGAAGLQAHYEFEGNTNDSSINARHGTIMVNPRFAAGRVGQAISFNGFNDYVEITGYKGILGSSAVTVTAWIKTIDTETGAIIGWGAPVPGQRFGFGVDFGRLRLEHHGGNIQGDTYMNDGGWHHVAVKVQENATISYPEVALYLDGKDDTRQTTSSVAFNLTAAEDVSIGRRPAYNDRLFLGQVDEVRIYNQALTQEEIAWLSGRTKAFDRPF